MSTEVSNHFEEFDMEDEDEYGLSPPPNRMIVLGAPNSKRYMIVSNDPLVVDALAQHKWTWEMDDDNPHFSGVWKAKNADSSSIWQYAEDLIVFTLIKTKTDTKGRVLVPTPEMYFEVVHIVPSMSRKPFDLRNHQLKIRLRKIGKSKLERNKIANDKFKLKVDAAKEKDGYMRKLYAYDVKRERNPEDDDGKGVLNDWSMRLGPTPEEQFAEAEHEAELASIAAMLAN